MDVYAMTSTNQLLIILIGSLSVITLVAIIINSVMIQDRISETNEKLDSVLSTINKTDVHAFSDSNYIDAAKTMFKIAQNNQSGHYQFSLHCEGDVNGFTYQWGCSDSKQIGEEAAIDLIMRGIADDLGRHISKFDPQNTTKYEDVLKTIVTPDGICNAYENHLDLCYKTPPVAIKAIYYGVQKWEVFPIKTLENGMTVYHHQPDYFVSYILLNNGTIVNGTLAHDVDVAPWNYGIKRSFILYGEKYSEFPDEHGNQIYTYETIGINGSEIDPRSLGSLP